MSERKLETLRTLGGKSVNKRLPAGLRNPEGVLVKDQSCWGNMIHEHFGAKFRRVTAQNHGATRALWKARLRRAQQLGDKPGELSFEEFKEVLGLVKPKVATGRDNIPGTIVRFLPDSVFEPIVSCKCGSIVGSGGCPCPQLGGIRYLSGSEERGTFQGYPTGAQFRWFLHCTRCMKCACGRCWTKNSGPLPNQLVGFQGPVCSA